MYENHEVSQKNSLTLKLPIGFGQIFFFLSFRPFPLNRVATAYHHSPNLPVFNVRLLHTNFPHIFFTNRSTLTVRLMYSFLILSFLVTHIANLNIFISATSISFTYFFVTATVSSSYTIGPLCFYKLG